MAYLTGRYPDKILFLDVWATRCGPCLDGLLNHSPGLIQHYKGKDVIFINVCIQSDIKSWQKLAQKLNTNSENFFFNDTASAKFCDAYEIKGYPTYMIIGKDGGLVTNKAPGYGQDERLKKIFDNLLAL